MKPNRSTPNHLENPIAWDFLKANIAQGYSYKEMGRSTSFASPTTRTALRLARRRAMEKKKRYAMT